MRRSYTILHVDDDEDDIYLIAKAFEKYTHHLYVTHAGNGREALTALQKMKERNSLPCLILLDINMPVMGGKDMLSVLKKDDVLKEIPVILFTTSGSIMDKVFAERYGAEFITKPTSYDKMEELIKEFTDKCNFEVNGRN